MEVFYMKRLFMNMVNGSITTDEVKITTWLYKHPNETVLLGWYDDEGKYWQEGYIKDGKYIEYSEIESLY